MPRGTVRNGDYNYEKKYERYYFVGYFLSVHKFNKFNTGSGNRDGIRSIKEGVEGADEKEVAEHPGIA